MRGPLRQEGVALIMVLLAMALVVLLASGMIHKQGLRIFKTGHYLAQQQGQSIALGAEVFAIQMLRDDFETDKEDSRMVDGPEDDWAAYSAIIPLDNNVIEVQIDDLGGRINLNDLLDAQGQVDPLTRDRLDRLFQKLGLIGVSVDALIDWMDSNEQTVSAYGAEDGQYLVKDPSYRAANQPFTDVSELMLVEGMIADSADEPDPYELLEPHVTALPVSGVPINVNMASEEVLLSLDNKITEQKLNNLLEKREEKAWETVGDFLAEPELAGLGLKADGLAVRTYFFEVVSRVTVNDRSTSLVSKISRSSQGEISTISRDMGQKNRITKSVYTGEEDG